MVLGGFRWFHVLVTTSTNALIKTQLYADVFIILIQFHVHAAALVSGIIEGAQGPGFFFCLLRVLLTFLGTWRGIPFGLVVILLHTHLAFVYRLINSTVYIIGLWREL